MKRVPLFLLVSFLLAACTDTPTYPEFGSDTNPSFSLGAEVANGAEFNTFPLYTGIHVAAAGNQCWAGTAADPLWPVFGEIGQNDWFRTNSQGFMGHDVYEHRSAPIRVLFGGSEYNGMATLRFVEIQRRGEWIMRNTSAVGKVTGPLGGEFTAECKIVITKNGLGEMKILVY